MNERIHITMYQYSRAIYTSIKDLVDPYVDPDKRVEYRHRVLAACHDTVERLARDPRYFARPERALFQDIRLYFPMTRQAEVAWKVSKGIGLAVAGTIAFTQVTPQSSLAVLSVSLVVRGLGLGSTMMPAMAAAYGALTRDEVPRATSALNIVQRVGGSVGSALLAVILQQNISAALPGSVGAEAAGSVPPAVRERVAEPLSSAFGETFWIALVLTVVAVIPALFLPRKAPASGETPGAVPAVAGHG